MVSGKILTRLDGIDVHEDVLRSEMALDTFEFFNTISSTKIGQSTRSAKASASLGRESIVIISPSRSTQISA